MEVLRLGGKLDGFTHWRVSSSSKPSDPDDVAWECACGLCRSPEHIERHWKAELTNERAAPAAVIQWIRERLDFDPCHECDNATLAHDRLDAAEREFR